MRECARKTGTTGATARTDPEESRMGVDDLINQGKDFLDQNKDKIEGALKSEQAEDISDNVLDAVSDFAKKVAPESAHEQIDNVRKSVDGAIGNE